MKKILFFIVLIIMSSAGFAKPILNIQHWNTKQGVRVLFVETHELPILDIQIIFNAGSAQDGNRFGIALFTNAMLNEGTEKLTADQIADEFDRVGARFEAAVDQDVALVGLRSLTEQELLDSALDTLAQVLTEPSFSRKDFQRVQQQILSIIQQKQQSPNSIANDAFYKLLYGNFPYSHPVSGTKKTVLALKPKDLKDFYQKYYVAKNAIVAMVGDVTLEQAKRIVDRILSKLPLGQKIDELPGISSDITAQIKHIPFPSEQTHVLMGQMGIMRQDRNFFPFLVGNYILGQSPLTSELFQEVRNKRGFAYSVGSQFSLLRYRGPFFMYLQTHNTKTTQAIQVVKQTLNKFIQEGPTNAQLSMAKKSLIGQFPLKLMDNQKILHYLTIIGFYQLPLDYLDTYRDHIKAVTLKQIQDAFSEQIHLNQMVTVTVGPEKSM